MKKAVERLREESETWVTAAHQQDEAEDAALLLDGLRAARDEFGLRGSAYERYAEQRGGKIREGHHASCRQRRLREFDRDR